MVPQAGTIHSIVGMLRSRDSRHRRNVGAAVPLQQTLMGGSQEREPVEVVLVVDFDAFREAGRGVTRDNQADQYTVDIHLVAVWRSTTANTTAVSEHRIHCRVEGNDVARGDVSYRDGPIQVDRFNDVHAGPLE